MNTQTLPARIKLACAFPPMAGFYGATTTIRELGFHGLVNRVWTPTKRDAVQLITSARMEAVESSGHGNKAFKRAAMIEAEADALWYDQQALTAQDVDEMGRIAELRRPGCHEL